MGERKVAIIVLLFCFCLLVFGSGIACASSENWSEVTRFTGSESIQTELFTCDYVEWRIRWEFDPGHWHFPQLHTFSVTTYPQGEDTFYVDSIFEMANGSKSGTSYIHDNDGKFYMIISTGIIANYTIIVEQNLESIPEFPSWAPMLLTLIALTVILAVYRKRLPKTPNNQSY